MAPEMTDEFGHWLAGFIDGEACFDIVKLSKDYNYYCRLAIQVRQDEMSIME